MYTHIHMQMHSDSNILFKKVRWEDGLLNTIVNIVHTPVNTP